MGAGWERLRLCGDYTNERALLPDCVVVAQSNVMSIRQSANITTSPKKAGHKNPVFFYICLLTNENKFGKLTLRNQSGALKMEFKKLAWFYEILVNGEKVGSVQKNRNKWEATGKDNWIYTGNTRKEAAENLINQNR